MKLTDNEVKALNKIAKSEYQDGGNPVGHAVWTSYCNPFSNKRTFSGVIASLVKKGCVTTGGSSADANPEAGCDGTTLTLTQAGYDALVAVLKPIREAEAKMAKPKRIERLWPTHLDAKQAQQDSIVVGDMVRAYDFPGMRDDVYVEGVVKERTGGRVLIHILRDLYQHTEVMVGNRFECWSPLGTSSMSGAPCVFLIKKREVRS